MEPTNNDKEGGEKGNRNGDAAQRQRQLQTQVAEEDADASPHGKPNQGLLHLHAMTFTVERSCCQRRCTPNT